MKTLWLFLVRLYISIGLFFYFKKITVVKDFNVPKNYPVLFLGNHQNALLDPLLIAITSGRYCYFLTRAQAFKKQLIAKLLKSLQLIPVYRIRDGWQTVSQNNFVFNYCVSVLSKNKAVTIFPEGNHNLKRTVRPLSKGFTRIVFGALKENSKTKLLLIPVGFNYKNASSFPDSVAIHYGKPIEAKHYKLDNITETTKQLKNDVYASLTKLTTHIESSNYDVLLNKLNAKHVNYLHPESVNNCMASNFKNCKTSSRRYGFKKIKYFFKMLLILSCFMPYLFWKKIIKPKIKEVEFISTYRFVVAIVLTPLWLLMVALFLTCFFTLNIALIYISITIIIALLAVKL